MLKIRMSKFVYQTEDDPIPDPENPNNAKNSSIWIKFLMVILVMGVLVLVVLILRRRYALKRRGTSSENLPSGEKSDYSLISNKTDEDSTPLQKQE